MRVLMFGWEFPPHIAGGLGTACYGMTKGLAYNDVDVLFVMPSASGDEDQSAVKIINASDVAVDVVNATVDEFLGKVQFVHIGTNMIPYVDPQDFTTMVERNILLRDFMKTEASTVWDVFLNFMMETLHMSRMELLLLQPARQLFCTLNIL